MSNRFLYLSILVLIFKLGFVHLGLTQDWNENRQNLIYNLSNFRAELLLRDTTTTYDLKDLMDKWNRTDEHASKEDLFQFTTTIVFWHRYGNANFEKFVKYVRKNHPASRLINGFTEEDFDTVLKNLDIIDLINIDILSGEYPYHINGSCGLFKELEFYGIMANDTIAEIGSGNGMFSLLLALMRDDICIYVNEIRKYLIEYISNKFDNNQRHLNRQSLVPIHGRKNNTKLPHHTFDKIIVRNSFHHFSRKEQMLASIASALKTDGQLFIMEYPTELDEDGDVCSLSMSIDEIKRILFENDFTLIDEKRIAETLLLRYVVDSP